MCLNISGKNTVCLLGSVGRTSAFGAESCGFETGQHHNKFAINGASSSLADDLADDPL